MMKRYPISRNLETLGWVGGLAVATAANYMLIPLVTERTGQRLIAISIGLAAGLLILLAFGEAARRLAKARRKQGHRARRVSSAMRVYVALTALTVLALLLNQLFDIFPPGSAR